MGQVPNGLSLQGASNDMQHDLPRSTFDLDLRSNFEVDLNLFTAYFILRYFNLRAAPRSFDWGRIQRHPNSPTPKI